MRSYLQGALHSLPLCPIYPLRLCRYPPGHPLAWLQEEQASAPMSEERRRELIELGFPGEAGARASSSSGRQRDCSDQQPRRACAAAAAAATSAPPLLPAASNTAPPHLPRAYFQTTDMIT